MGMICKDTAALCQCTVICEDNEMNIVLGNGDKKLVEIKKEITPRIVHATETSECMFKMNLGKLKIVVIQIAWVCKLMVKGSKRRTKD